MEKIKPKELVSLLNKELTRMQYKNSSLIQHRRNWAKLVVFFEEIQEEYFSMKTAMKYLDDTCDFFAKEMTYICSPRNHSMNKKVNYYGDNIY